MINRYFLLCGMAAALFSSGGAAFAQNCRVVTDELAKLKTVELGGYSLWDTVFGEIDRDEAYKAALVIEDGHVLAAGLVSLEGSEHRQLLISRIGRNGRVLWTEFHDVAGLQDVVGLQPHEKGYMVVADRTDEKGRGVVWAGVFNSLGTLLSEKSVADARGNLKAFDLMRMDDGMSYLLAASLDVKSGGQPPSAMLMRLGPDGALREERGYVTGLENRISGLDMLDDGRIVATGFNYGADGRKNGWILNLNADLSLNWQQVYPRGAGAALVAAQPMVGNMIAVVGTSAPARKDAERGGWVMVVGREDGAVGWQRFYTSDMHYNGRDILVSPDGIISALFDGEKKGKEDVPEHARLITLNPRGVMLGSEAYASGEGVDVYRMVSGANQERILIGRSLVAHQVENPQAKTEAEKISVRRSRQAWLLAAPSVEPYEDPCRQPVNFLP